MITFGEFNQGLDAIGFRILEEDSLKIFTFLDIDGDGHIVFDEFCDFFEGNCPR